MNQDIINLLQKGGVGILPTDTLYGLVGVAENPQAVEKIYQIKGRSPEKPLIILISSINDLEKFNITLDSPTKKFLENIWPNKVSVILPCDKVKFEYLHRGTKTLAFRLPNYPELIEIIKQTGPLVAPTVNPERLPPAETIEDAKKYFDGTVAFYLDKGKLSSEPSTIIEIKNNQVKILRAGAFNIPELEHFPAYKKQSNKLGHK